MKHQFTLPSFPNSNFEIEASFWTGKQILYKDYYIAWNYFRISNRYQQLTEPQLINHLARN